MTLVFFMSNQEDEGIKGKLLPDTRRLHIHHKLQPSPSLHRLTLGQTFEDIQLLPGNNRRFFIYLRLLNPHGPTKSDVRNF